jgi:hypothetical protein
LNIVGEGRTATATAADAEVDSGCTASKWFACMLGWQQLCDAGVCMLPQLPFIF